MSEPGETTASLEETQDYVELGYRLLSEVRRSSPRVELNLPARCLFADGSDVPACIRDVSCSGLAVDCYKSGIPGEPIIIDINHLDRFDGKIVRRSRTGFAVKLRITEYRRKNLRLKLEQLAKA